MLHEIKSLWIDLQSQPRHVQWLAQYMLTILITISCAYFLWQPRYAEIQKLKQASSALSAKITLQGSLLSHRWSLGDKSIEHQQQRIKTLFPEANTKDDLASHLVEPLILTGSRLQSWRSLPAVKQRDWLQQLWQVEIKGQYPALMIFLHHLLARPELLLIERAELVSDQEQVILKVQLSRYQLTENKSP